jgi:hypothetical protein
MRSAYFSANGSCQTRKKSVFVPTKRNATFHQTKGWLWKSL